MIQAVDDLVEILNDENLKTEETYMVFAVSNEQIKSFIRFSDSQIGEEVSDTKKAMASCWTDAVNVATILADKMVESYSLDDKLPKEQLLGLFLASIGTALGKDMNLNNGKVLKATIDFYADEFGETKKPLFELGKN